MSEALIVTSLVDRLDGSLPRWRRARFSWQQVQNGLRYGFTEKRCQGIDPETVEAAILTRLIGPSYEEIVERVRCEWGYIVRD